jgi:type IV pilus assembly protein PilC
MYFSSFASMLNSGMSMHETVEQLAERGPCRTLRKASGEMGRMVLEGKPITKVMPRYPAAFSPFVIALVEAGQTSGGLEAAMRQLAAHFEHVKELENLARAQSFYTKILIVMLIILPTLAPFVLEGAAAWLPIIVRRVVLVALGFGFVWYGWRTLMRLDFLRRGVDRVKLLIPWAGSLVRRAAVARWCRAMAMLYAAGVPVHTALEAAGMASGNQAIAASTKRLAFMVLAGEPISTVMEESGDFPDQAVSMMLVGEKSGSVDSALNKVADYYEAEVATGSKQGIMVATVLAYLVVAGIYSYYIITGWTGYTNTFNEFMQDEP